MCCPACSGRSARIIRTRWRPGSPSRRRWRRAGTTPRREDGFRDVFAARQRTLGPITRTR